MRGADLRYQGAELLSIRHPKRVFALLATASLALLVGSPTRGDQQVTVAPIAGPVLNLSPCKITFEDDFHDLSISGRPGAGTVWYSHTPWNGDFGDAQFGDPGPASPFSLGPMGLDITATRAASGRWTGGLISSRDRDGPQGRGFAQMYGYFEMKAQLPAGDGVWPAFWLVGVNKDISSSEIDVLEFYGRFSNLYNVTPHIWRKNNNSWGKVYTIQVPKNQLSTQFNLFGVYIGPHITTYFFNRRLIVSMPTPPEYQQPFYILANLAMGGGWPITGATSPQVMHISYIRAYQCDLNHELDFN